MGGSSYNPRRSEVHTGMRRQSPVTTERSTSMRRARGKYSQHTGGGGNDYRKRENAGNEFAHNKVD